MKKLFKSMLIVCLIYLATITTQALVVGDWEAEISNNEAIIIGYTGECTEKMELPAYLGNFKVVGLGGCLFDGNVKEIVIPEGYRFIREPENVMFNPYSGSRKNVFYNVRKSLEYIHLPQSLEVLEASFRECIALKEITIPAKVKSLPVILHDSNKYYGIFDGCESLEYVYLNEGLETIGERTFYDCKSLKDIKLPNTLKSIEGNAFYNCDSLKSLVIPNSVTNFGKRTYVARDGKTYTKTAPVIIDCDNLETVVLSDNTPNLLSYGEVGMFVDHTDGELAKCPKLSDVYLGKSLSSIDYAGGLYAGGTGVLGFNDSLKTIILPEGLQEIGNCFLYGSDNVETLVIPASVIRIGETDAYDSDGTCKGTNKKPLPKLFIYGYNGSRAQSFANEEGFPFVDISTATPTNSKVLVNGKEVAFTAYNIGGNNYFKLRDVATAINGTAKSFNVGWDGNNNAISLTSGQAYQSVGGELVVNSGAQVTSPRVTNSKVFVDGELTTFMAFNIDGNNYFKLRDIGQVFDIGIGWDGSTQTITIDTSSSYTE